MLDELWLTYYRTTFNPARLRVKAMTSEMPKHYWQNMPETASIPAMVAGAPDPHRRRWPPARPTRRPPSPRASPRARHGAGAAVPATPLGADRAPRQQPARAARSTPTRPRPCSAKGRRRAASCSSASSRATRRTSPAGPSSAPPGRCSTAPWRRPGSTAAALYVTNAVKHFKFEPRGKRRIHKKPNAGEIEACRWWLDRELATRPARADRRARRAPPPVRSPAAPVSVMRERGPADFADGPGFITVHPSFLLRLPDPAEKARQYDLLRRRPAQGGRDRPRRRPGLRAKILRRAHAALDSGRRSAHIHRAFRPFPA